MSGYDNEHNTSNKYPKQQGGSLLPVWDHDFKVYHTTEWYQWELNAQVLAKGTTQLNAMHDVSTKAKELLIKLLAVHGKDNINAFAKTKQCLEVENFPKGAKEMKDLLAYKTTDGCYKNVSMILHVNGLIPFGTFKSKIFNWLKINNTYLNMTIFKSTKETVTEIGHLIKINPTQIYHVACQEQLNDALAIIVSELDERDKTYFQNYGTSWEIANFEVQLKPAKSNITVGHNHVETSTLAVNAL
eukprot:7742089-Ditylum_brightwellii.AAC.1